VVPRSQGACQSLPVCGAGDRAAPRTETLQRHVQMYGVFLCGRSARTSCAVPAWRDNTDMLCARSSRQMPADSVDSSPREEARRRNRRRRRGEKGILVPAHCSGHSLSGGRPCPGGAVCGEQYPGGNPCFVRPGGSGRRGRRALQERRPRREADFFTARSRESPCSTHCRDGWIGRAAASAAPSAKGQFQRRACWEGSIQRTAPVSPASNEAHAGRPVSLCRSPFACGGHISALFSVEDGSEDRGHRLGNRRLLLRCPEHSSDAGTPSHRTCRPGLRGGHLPAPPRRR